MNEKAAEENRLAAAERHIATAEELISVHRQRLAAMEDKGWSTENERNLLKIMLDVLDVMQLHRKQILARLAELSSTVHNCESASKGTNSFR